MASQTQNWFDHIVRMDEENLTKRIDVRSSDWEDWQKKRKKLGKDGENNNELEGVEEMGNV